jgi:hypothetical protein
MQNPPDRRGRQDPKLLLLEVPADRLRASIELARGQRSTQLKYSLTDLWRGRSGGPVRPSRTRLDSVQATGPIASQKAMKVPVGEPILGSSSDGQLVGNDLENSNTGSRHARKGHPRLGGTPAAAHSGSALRASPPRLAAALVTYVPTHERPITWDICSEPTHLQAHFARSALLCGSRAVKTVVDGGLGVGGYRSWVPNAVGLGSTFGCPRQCAGRSTAIHAAVGCQRSAVLLTTLARVRDGADDPRRREERAVCCRGGLANVM